MDLLKRELERKKKVVALAKEKTASATGDGSSRTFLKATELRRIQEEQEEEERKRKRKQLHYGDGRKKSENDGEKKRARTSDDEADKKVEKVSDTTEAPPATETAAKGSRITLEDLSSTEVLTRLRSMGLPIRLFAETESERLERLEKAMDDQKHIKADQTELDEFRLGQGHGIRNPFIGRKKESEEATEIASVPTPSKAEAAPSPRKGVNEPSEAAKIDTAHDEDDDDPHKRIYRFFKGLLRQWEEELASRPEAVKRTAAGKNETKTLKQCKDYIRPLFKLCKTRRLEPSLMGHIIKIVDYCEAGEFVKAHDSYIDMAIGRAAWPIGVTMVGIHARSGRAKIESANVAHVMNSELQRKYLTSVKRLMSYCQKKREDVAPSKKVLS